MRFFNVPVQAPTRGLSSYGYSEKCPISVAFCNTHGGYGGDIRDLTPDHPFPRVYMLKKAEILSREYVLRIPSVS